MGFPRGVDSIAGPLVEKLVRTYRARNAMACVLAMPRYLDTVRRLITT
jgi:hypothetical protein